MTRRPSREWTFWAAIGWLSLLVLGSVFTDLLPLHDPTETFEGTRIKGPSSTHWLGSDGLGRDILSRLVHGSQVSLIVAATGAGLALIIGGFLGLVAGYYRGLPERAVTVVVDTTLVIPPLILALSLILFLDADGDRRLTILSGVFVLLSIAPMARVVRSATVVWAQREFVSAAEVMGAPRGRVMFREILPNVAPSVISYSFLVMATLVVVEGAVAFLGLSLPPPTPTWGDMINNGRADLTTAPHIALIPATVLFLTVLSLNMVGDHLETRLAPGRVRI